MTGTPGASELHARCEITLYRLYDVGYEIDLAGAEAALAANDPERLRPSRAGAQAIQIPNPPLAVRLGSESVQCAGDRHDVEFSARLFDFGVVSLRARLTSGGVQDWSRLAAWSSQVTGDPEWAACFAG